MAKATVYLQTATGEVFSTTFPEYHKECTQLTKAEGERIYKEQERAALRKWLKPGTTVYTKVESVSSSGMSRRISVYAISPAKKGEQARIVNISGTVASVTGYTHAKNGGISIHGCGMDMGFAIVYALGAALWPKGTPKPHGLLNGTPDRSGVYALKHSWL